MVRRITPLLLPVLLVAAAILSIRCAGPARADGAMVVWNSGAVILDGNGQFVGTSDTHEVILPDGHILFICQGTVAPSSTGGAVQWNVDNTGLVYVLGTLVTLDWHETVGASGPATLFIRF
jgi:hypothetical protein